MNFTLLWPLLIGLSVGAVIILSLYGWAQTIQARQNKAGINFLYEKNFLLDQLLSEKPISEILANLGLLVKARQMLQRARCPWYAAGWVSGVQKHLERYYRAVLIPDNPAAAECIEMSCCSETIDKSTFNLPAIIVQVLRSYSPEVISQFYCNRFIEYASNVRNQMLGRLFVKDLVKEKVWLYCLEKEKIRIFENCEKILKENENPPEGSGLSDRQKTIYRLAISDEIESLRLFSVRTKSFVPSIA